VHVTLPDCKRRRRPGLIEHSAALPRSEYCVRDGIAVTQVPRTLLDLAVQVSRDELETAVNEAYARRLCARPQLDAVVARHRGRRGTAALAGAAGLEMTRSTPERRLLRAVCASELPPPEANARIGGYEVDLLWRDVGLIVEVDAWSTHGSKQAFARDRRRDARLAALGLTVIRIPADEGLATALATIRAAYEALRRRRTAGGA
jgi:very-short-patch-repair endonuclease